MIRKIHPNWRWAWQFEGGDPNCDHTYEENDAIDDEEYSAKHICIKCNAKMEYDVSDIGD